MNILGIQASPRQQGNTSTLLAAFLAEAKHLGAETFSLDVAGKKINPCIACGICEREGCCPVNDDMQEIYPLLWKADLIVVASPIFFYTVPAQLKALIDRCQSLWVRKYIHNIADPGSRWRKGYFLSVGATNGKNLFKGMTLTMKYFFDAAGAEYGGSLTFRKIEKPGDIIKHPTALQDIKEKTHLWVKPFLSRKKILFVCTENSCRSQMAQAFTQFYGGDTIEAESAGSAPGEKINDLMVAVMKEKGIDMAFRRPKSTAQISSGFKPDFIVTMGCRDACPFFPGVPYQDWGLTDPAGQSIEFMRTIRDAIEKKVQDFFPTIKTK